MSIFPCLHYYISHVILFVTKTDSSSNISSHCLLAVLFLSLCLFQLKMERDVHATSLKITTTFVVDSTVYRKRKKCFLFF